MEREKIKIEFVFPPKFDSIRTSLSALPAETHSQFIALEKALTDLNREIESMQAAPKPDTGNLTSLWALLENARQELVRAKKQLPEPTANDIRNYITYVYKYLKSLATSEEYKSLLKSI